MGYRSVSYDLGYVVMPDGDIVTSDGKPRVVDEVQLRLVQKAAGRVFEFKFRAPRPEEVEVLREQGILCA